MYVHISSRKCQSSGICLLNKCLLRVRMSNLINPLNNHVKKYIMSWQLNIWGNWDTERLKTFTLAQPRNKQCSLDSDPCLEDPEQKYFHNSLTDGVRADLPTSPGSGGIYMVSTGIHALAQLCPGVCQPFWLSSIAPFRVLNAASATFGVPRSPSEGVVWAELGANIACIGSIFIDDWWKEGNTMKSWWRMGQGAGCEEWRKEGS